MAKDVRNQQLTLDGLRMDAVHSFAELRTVLMNTILDLRAGRVTVMHGITVAALARQVQQTSEAQLTHMAQMPPGAIIEAKPRS